MPNQIRLTVRGPRGGSWQGAEACDVMVTAPPGTVLAAVTGGLVAAWAAAASGAAPAAPSRESQSAAVYADGQRLDAQRHALGEPPLVDGAVVTLYQPGEPSASLAPGVGPRLHVVAGPDAGGVHLLHGGHIRIGRSADADVVLDDPDVSRLHCVVTVTESGAVSLADLGSTNGTTADGAPVGERPVPLRPGASLRVGESVLRLRTDPVPLPHDPSLPAQRTPLPGAHAAEAPAAQPASRQAAALAYVPEQTGPGGRGEPLAPAGPAGSVTHGTGVAGIPAAGSPGAPVAAPGPPPGAPGAPPEHATAEADRRAARGIGAWARRFSARRPPAAPGPYDGPAPAAPGGPVPVPDPGRWPDPADVLLTALGHGPRLWERHVGQPAHEDALTVRLGTAHHGARAGSPVTVSLREAGSLGLAGPRNRLLPLARSVLAQLATLHPPSSLEIVLLASGRGAPRTRDWSWLGWLPHLRPARGQDCRLLLAFDREQATARTAELSRRLDDGPLGPGWTSAERHEVRAAAARHTGPATVLVVDGDPGTAALRETVARLTSGGAAAGVHVLCLAETAPATPSSPQSETLAAAGSVLPAFHECGAVGLLSGAVATAVRVVRRGGDRVGEPATVDGVSAPWAERVARSLAPLREAETAGTGAGVPAARHAAPLPDSSRLLEELGLARATPAAVLARWPEPGGRPPGAALLLGAGPRGPVDVDVAAARSHVLVSGAAGSGKSELLCSAAAALAVSERPDRLGLLLVDGGSGQALWAATELPHTTLYLSAGDPVRMRSFAQALTGELKRRAELLDGHTYEAFVARDGQAAGHAAAAEAAAGRPTAGGATGVPVGAEAAAGAPDADRGTLRLRPRAAVGEGAAAPLPRLVVLVDDLDALVAPALGNPGRPAAGSVVRALEAVAREGLRLGVHLVCATGRPDRTAHTVADQGSALRVALGGGPEADCPPGRGVLHLPDGASTPFQASRVTARIPRTATQRPTVQPLDWARAGDPPTRRPVRELGNGPTDLALLASAIERAAVESGTARIPPPG
ncbi:FtsK/SpoIIIE domain-containing protein [Streptomyces sp. WMMC1477]|uniref:FtsK/SpoIIIE domain-containing protein n=1 Tax=Streptomyces sp. WMMC1477 TaxID=3015155 RepID=UPI0022B6093D|nr:FtsK/SpoIIIE domain-containing protein [Streptomyces sp. WMMC1477]MCZ7431489.1 FtsK/SpoIIIE domain-containing protein [Streptomyces sp. WMMC1477]